MPLEIEWSYIENEIRYNKGKLSILAKKYGYTSVVFKSLLINHFGVDNLDFKKGRKGGIFFKKLTVGLGLFHDPPAIDQKEVSNYRSIQSSHPPVKII